MLSKIEPKDFCMQNQCSATHNMLLLCAHMHTQLLVIYIILLYPKGICSHAKLSPRSQPPLQYYSYVSHARSFWEDPEAHLQFINIRGLSLNGNRQWRGNYLLLLNKERPLPMALHRMARSNNELLPPSLGPLSLSLNPLLAVTAFSSPLERAKADHFPCTFPCGTRFLTWKLGWCKSLDAAISNHRVLLTLVFEPRSTVFILYNWLQCFHHVVWLTVLVVFLISYKRLFSVILAIMCSAHLSPSSLLNVELICFCAKKGEDRGCNA